MLEAFSLRQKGSKEKNAGDLLKRGFLLVEKKEYKQATIELTLANEKNSEQTVKELKTKFKEYCDIEDFEAIRSIGLVLLKTNESDCELLNTLGNCARRLKDYEQANHFYRLAIKQDNSYS
ncbi:tetratricopeptide repeat protein, partial [bacterium]|nr:tetratricopeptide repeat protein [bacterium]